MGAITKPLFLRGLMILGLEDLGTCSRISLSQRLFNRPCTIQILDACYEGDQFLVGAPLISCSLAPMAGRVGASGGHWVSWLWID